MYLISPDDIATILESPIVLVSSLQIGKAYDATVRWIARRDPKAGERVMPAITTPRRLRT